uniref:F5/8 type C domain-containing protein n=1 Tax=Romanomermis culicivorax TaxID=13658 RepID=A0A915KRS5_ROMCU
MTSGQFRLFKSNVVLISFSLSLISRRICAVFLFEMRKNVETLECRIFRKERSVSGNRFVLTELIARANRLILCNSRELFSSTFYTHFILIGGFRMRRRNPDDIWVYCWIVLAASFFEDVRCMIPNKCDQALGMESRSIRDEQLSASSSFSIDSVGPRSSRLKTDIVGGAWCPQNHVDKISREYLQIDLPSVHVLTAVATQGRYGQGLGQEFATHFFVEYFRPGNNDWIRYKNRTGIQIFEGNSDTNTVIERKLNPSIIASKIRIFPYSSYARTICMRAEIFGCKYREPGSNVHGLKG